MNPIIFIAGYVVLTTLFWIGNRNVKLKKPRNSAIKWLLWTTTWISFSIMLLELPAKDLTAKGIFGPLLVSPFAYPILFTKDLPIATLIMIAIAPMVAACLGYILARKHNEARADPDAKPIRKPERPDFSNIKA